MKVRKLKFGSNFGSVIFVTLFKWLKHNFGI